MSHGHRWVMTPLYGALFAPVYLIVRDVGAVVLAGVGAGAALTLIVRRMCCGSR